MPSPTSMLRSMTGREYAEWMAFMTHEPMGWPALNLHQAVLRGTLAGKRPQELLILPKRELDQAKETTRDAMTITPQQAVAYTQALLSMGTPGIKLAAGGE